MTKAIIIARVSTEEQKEAGNSLPAQIVRLKNYCNKRGYKIIKQFSFDESAYKTKRDDFDQILNFVLSQKEKIAVCFDKVDRFSRNVFDKRVATLYEKATKSELELHFISDGLVINDQKSASEKFQFTIGLSLAKYYSDAISDNVKRAQEQMLRDRIWPSKAPFGYENIDADNGKKNIVLHPYNSKIVRKMYEWYSTGASSLLLIRNKLEQDYSIDWSKGYVDSIFRNPFYYGEMKWKDKLYPHKYDTIISLDLFNKVQAIKAGHHKKHFKYAGLPFAYRGLVRCSDCGCIITPERKTKKSGNVYHYYHCTQYKGKHGAEWLTEDNLTKQFASLFKKMQMPKEVLDDITDTLKNVHHNKSEFRQAHSDKLHKEKEKYQKRIENIYIDWVDRSITKDVYDKYHQQFRKKLSDIEYKEQNLQKAEDDYYLTASCLLELASRASELFESSEVEEKRQLLKLVLQNCELKGKKLEFTLEKPFDTVLHYADRSAWLPG